MHKNKQVWEINEESSIDDLEPLIRTRRKQPAEKPKVRHVEKAVEKSEEANTNNQDDKDLTSLPYVLAESRDFSQETKIHMLFGYYYTKVLNAYKKNQIFTVYGEYYTIRRSLLQRGWLEKLLPTRYQQLQQLPDDTLLLSARPGNVQETIIISKIIHSFPAFFIWQPKLARNVNTDILPFRSRIYRNHDYDFTTKVGLSCCVKNQLPTQLSGVPTINYPRSYCLIEKPEDCDAFIEDYRKTQCRCLIMFLWNNLHCTKLYIDPEYGTISPKILEFALHVILVQLKSLQPNTKTNVVETPHTDEEWKEFIQLSNRVIEQKEKIKMTFSELSKYLKKGILNLENIMKIHPDYNWDGELNMWLLKPGYKYRGIGIVVHRSLQEILDFAKRNRDHKYIVQKYIERPLLIYKTKFDIRGYMLQTIVDDELSIWLYKDCYLRFSSQEFTLTSYRPSIHLTNNSVQKLYRNSKSRDARLPLKNMWSLEQFKHYMRSESEEIGIWENKILNGFAKNLIAVVLSSYRETKMVEKTFELFGCDFMLDERMKPILIEINATPDMSPSTDVTAKLCPQVLSDVIKVVVDLARDPTASTGQFELILKLSCTTDKKPRENVRDADTVAEDEPLTILYSHAAAHKK